jgi:hypothetical protein
MPQVLTAGDRSAEGSVLPLAERLRNDRCGDNGLDWENTDLLAVMLQPDPLRGARGLVLGIMISLMVWAVAGTAAWVFLRG